jgi:hypothetical protein
MHAVIRSYSGASAKKLFDLLDEHKGDVERALRAVPGFTSYLLLRTADGGTSVTVCRDKAGCDASMKVAADWVKANAGDLKTAPPMVSEGNVLINAH